MLPNTLQGTGQAPNKGLSCPKVSSAKGEKPCSRPWQRFTLARLFGRRESQPLGQTSRADTALQTHLIHMARPLGTEETCCFEDGPGFQGVNESARRDLKEVVSEQLSLGCLRHRQGWQTQEIARYKRKLWFLSGLEKEKWLPEKL